MLIAGPCGLQSRESALQIAKFVKEQGATHFRGGVYKGQNRPIVNGKPEYKGLGDEGISILQEIQSKFNLPCVCDVQSERQAELVYGLNIANMMVGARNMDNLELLRNIRAMYDLDLNFDKIILKRGPSATVNEWLGAAEHLGGARRVILCERGTVHFDRHDYTRFRLDMLGVAEVKHYHPGYQVIVDISHGSGDRNLALLLAKMSLSIADGIMVEVHPNPDTSPTDAPQIVDYETFGKIATLYKEHKDARNNHGN